MNMCMEEQKYRSYSCLYTHIYIYGYIHIYIYTHTHTLLVVLCAYIAETEAQPPGRGEGLVGRPVFGRRARLRCEAALVSGKRDEGGRGHRELGFRV